MRTFHISQFELGIGDIVCSLYALNGFSQEHGRPPIKLYMRDHYDWPQIVDIPGLSIMRRDTLAGLGVSNFRNNFGLFDFILGDTAADYYKRLRAGVDPKQWYARKLGTQPVPPAIRRDHLAQPPDIKRPYVVLSPFATRAARTWEAGHWRVLADELTKAGYECVALDSPGQPQRCAPIGVEFFSGRPVPWIANVCLHAALVITNDSALAHVGGVLGAPTLVILSQQDPSKHFSMTANRSLVPDQPCVGCRFQPDRGYEPACEARCWTLQTISPQRVAERALALLADGRRANASLG